MDWDKNAKLCGNCRFWSLGNFQHDWEGAMPIGAGGREYGGSDSDCRKRAPIREMGYHTIRGEKVPVPHTAFPQTSVKDWCGDFESRGAT